MNRRRGYVDFGPGRRRQRRKNFKKWVVGKVVPPPPVTPEMEKRFFEAFYATYGNPPVLPPFQEALP